jgi:hypothetical protein
VTLPTAEDINIYDSLDERNACQNFLGKSVEQAEALFRENGVVYQEDLMWMGPVGFRFYVEAIVRYLESEAAAGDSDIVSCFAALLEFRLEEDHGQFVLVADRLVGICDYLIEHYDRFDVTPEIYGDVRARLAALRQTFSLLSPTRGGQ